MTTNQFVVYNKRLNKVEDVDFYYGFEILPTKKAFDCEYDPNKMNDCNRMAVAQVKILSDASYNYYYIYRKDGMMQKSNSSTTGSYSWLYPRYYDSDTEEDGFYKIRTLKTDTKTGTWPKENYESTKVQASNDPDYEI